MFICEKRSDCIRLGNYDRATTTQSHKLHVVVFKPLEPVRCCCRRLLNFDFLNISDVVWPPTTNVDHSITESNIWVVYFDQMLLTVTANPCRVPRSAITTTHQPNHIYITDNDEILAHTNSTCRLSCYWHEIMFKAFFGFLITKTKCVRIWVCSTKIN